MQKNNQNILDANKKEETNILTNTEEIKPEIINKEKEEIKPIVITKKVIVKDTVKVVKKIIVKKDSVIYQKNK